MEIKKTLVNLIENLKEYIKEKIKQAKDILKDGKNKVLEFLEKYKKESNKNKNSRISKDMIVKGKDKEILVAKKGTLLKGALSNLKSLVIRLFSQLEDMCNEIINICKKLLAEMVTIEKINKEELIKKQNEEIENLKKMAKRKERIEQAKEIGLGCLSLITGAAIVIGGKIVTDVATDKAKDIVDNITKPKNK